MFIALLIITFILAFGVSYLTAKLFEGSISKILAKIIKDEISSAWEKYLKFALIVAGISGGVRLWEIERYLPSQIEGERMLALTPERWALEIYRTIISSLQSIVWVLLFFFMTTLIAYIIVRGRELKREKIEN